MPIRRSRPIPRVQVLAAVLCLLLTTALVFPIALAAGPVSGLADDGNETPIDIDDDLPRDGATVELVVRLEEATVPESASTDAVERRLEEHAETTQDPLLEFAADRPGISVESEFWLTNAVLLEVDTDRVDLETFERFDAVEAIHENFEVTVPESVAVPPAANGTGTDRATATADAEVTTGLRQLRAPAVWDTYETRGEDVRVAVLDTGIDVDHPDLELATTDPTDPTYPGGWAEFDATGSRVVGSTPHDTGVHGTHVSGTIAGGAASGTAIGVAPDVELLHASVMGERTGSFAQIVAGMEWAVEREADVINMSLGATGKYAQFIDPVRNAEESGAIVVAAIGNEGHGTSGSPGNVYDALSVGAVDETGAVASFSGGERINRSAWTGSPSDWQSPETYTVPTLVAPGVAIESTVPGGGYERMPGTSMAAPHISGTVALLMAAEPTATPDEIETAMTETARIPDSESTAEADPATRYGSGIVDAKAALDALADVQAVTEPEAAEATGDETPQSEHSSSVSDVALALIALVCVGAAAMLVVRFTRRDDG